MSFYFKTYFGFLSLYLIKLSIIAWVSDLSTILSYALMNLFDEFGSFLSLKSACFKIKPLNRASFYRTNLWVLTLMSLCFFNILQFLDAKVSNPLNSLLFWRHFLLFLHGYHILEDLCERLFASIMKILHLYKLIVTWHLKTLFKSGSIKDISFTFLLRGD